MLDRIRALTQHSISEAMEEKTADRVMVKGEASGGIESLTDKVAYVAAIVGGVTGLALMFLGDLSFWLRLGSAVQFWIAAAVTFVLLRGMAEIIRLLKYSNGISYGGELSKVNDLASFACGACGAMVYKWDTCNECGATMNKSARKEERVKPNDVEKL